MNKFADESPSMVRTYSQGKNLQHSPCYSINTPTMITTSFNQNPNDMSANQSGSFRKQDFQQRDLLSSTPRKQSYPMPGSLPPPQIRDIQASNQHQMQQQITPKKGSIPYPPQIAPQSNRAIDQNMRNTSEKSFQTLGMLGQQQQHSELYDTKNQMNRYQKGINSNQCNSENSHQNNKQAQFNDYNQKDTLQQAPPGPTPPQIGTSQIYSSRSNINTSNLTASYNGTLPTLPTHQLDPYRYKQQQIPQQPVQQVLSASFINQQQQQQQQFQQYQQQSTPSKRLGQPPIAPTSTTKHVLPTKTTANTIGQTVTYQISAQQQPQQQQPLPQSMTASYTWNGQNFNPQNQNPQQFFKPIMNVPATSENVTGQITTIQSNREPFKNMSNQMYGSAQQQQLPTSGPSRILIHPSPQSLSSQKLLDPNSQRNRFLTTTSTNSTATIPGGMQGESIPHINTERSPTPEHRIFPPVVGSHSPTGTLIPQQFQQQKQNILDQVFDSVSPRAATTVVNPIYQRNMSQSRLISIPISNNINTNNNSNKNPINYSGEFGLQQQHLQQQQPQILQTKHIIQQNHDNKHINNIEGTQNIIFQSGTSYSMPSPNLQQGTLKSTLSGAKEISQMIYTDTSLFNFQNDKDQSFYNGSREASPFQTPHKAINRQLSYALDASSGPSAKKPIDASSGQAYHQMNYTTGSPAFQGQQHAQHPSSGQMTLRNSMRSINNQQQQQQLQQQQQFGSENNFIRCETNSVPQHCDSPRFNNEHSDVGKCNSLANPGFDTASKNNTNMNSNSNNTALTRNNSQPFCTLITPPSVFANCQNTQRNKESSSQMTSEKIYQMIEQMKSNKCKGISDDDLSNGQRGLLDEGNENARLNQFITSFGGGNLQDERSTSTTPTTAYAKQNSGVISTTAATNASATYRNNEGHYSPNLLETQNSPYTTRSGNGMFSSAKVQMQMQEEGNGNMQRIYNKYDSHTKNPFDAYLAQKMQSAAASERNYSPTKSPQLAQVAPPVPPPRATTTSTIRYSNQLSQVDLPVSQRVVDNGRSASVVPAQVSGQYVPSLSAATALHMQNQLREHEKTPEKQAPNRSSSSKSIGIVKANAISTSGATLKTPYENNINNYNNNNTPATAVQGISISNSNSKEPYPIQMTKELEKFSFGKVLGLGSYAVVRQVETTSGETFALKTYEKSKLQDPQKRKNVAREVKILSKVKHDNIVRLYDVIETDSQLHLVMELPSSTPLNVYIKSRPNSRLTEEEARPIFIQLVSAVKYCHRKSVVHRDIKMENVLFDAPSNRIKLIDFGFSIALAPQSKLNIFCGTPSYMAPEIVNKTEYTFPVDTWALGILLFKALNGYFPFRGHDDKELFKKINLCKLEFLPHISTSARNMLTKILLHSANERYTAEQVNNYLNSFIQSEKTHFSKDFSR